MSKKIRTEAVDYLFSAILSLENKEECYTFFEDICTINELLSLSQRFEVAKMLREHKTYLEIMRMISGTVSEKKQSLCLSEDYFSTYFLESILIKYMYCTKYHCLYCTKRSDFNWG